MRLHYAAAPEDPHPDGQVEGYLLKLVARLRRKGVPGAITKPLAGWLIDNGAQEYPKGPLGWTGPLSLLYRKVRGIPAHLYAIALASDVMGRGRNHWKDLLPVFVGCHELGHLRSALPHIGPNKKAHLGPPVGTWALFWEEVSASRFGRPLICTADAQCPKDRLYRQPWYQWNLAAEAAFLVRYWLLGNLALIFFGACLKLLVGKLYSWLFGLQFFRPLFECRVVQIVCDSPCVWLVGLFLGAWLLYLFFKPRTDGKGRGA